MPNLESLKKLCKKVLKNYPELKDIIIFGSFIRKKNNPKDIDLALIIQKYKVKSGTIGKITKEFDIFKKIDIEVIDSENIYLDPLFWRIAREGFSVKHNKFISKSAQIKPVVFYEYSLNGLSKTKKVQFNRAIHNTIKGNIIKKGSIWVPISESEKFKELINSWNLKTKSFEAVFMDKARI